MKPCYARSVDAPAPEPVDCVDPNIGTLLEDVAQLAHRIMEVDPITTPGIGDKYLADRIYAFFTEGLCLMPRT